MFNLKEHSGLLLAGSFLLACLLALWGLVTLWEQTHASSTAYLTRVIGELEKSKDVRDSVWSREFVASLRAMTDNSQFSTFVNRVSGLQLGRDVLTTLTGRPEERQSMLSLLAQRRSQEDMERLRAFAGQADFIRRELQNLAERYALLSACIYTMEGTPCLATGDLPARLPDISKNVVPDLVGTGNVAISLPAYVRETKLCVDIAIPMLLTDKRNVLTYNVGILMVTVDLGTIMERIQAAQNQQSMRTAVLERQNDGSLIALSATDTQKIAVRDLVTTEGGIAFGLYRIPGFGGPLYSMGQRFLSTRLYFLSALPEDAEELADTADSTTLLMTCAKAIVLLAGLFLFWFFVFRQREHTMALRLAKAQTRNLQREEALTALDRDLGMAIACTDFDHNILTANASFARLGGRDSAEDLAGLSTNDLPQDLAADMSQRTALLWEKPQANHGETRLFHKGVWKNCAVLAVPYVDQEGYLAGGIFIYRDIGKHLAYRERSSLLIEQNVVAMHKLVSVLDPYAGRLSALVAEMAQLLAELDTDKSPETARLLSWAGRLFVLGNTVRPENQICLPADKHTDGQADGHAGWHADTRGRRVAISLAGLDFDGLPVQETISGMYERLDGSGKPRGLTAEAISKASRYLGIAEELCTRMHPREGEIPQNWEDAFAPLLDTDKFDAAALRLYHYLKSPQGQRVLIRLHRKQ